MKKMLMSDCKSYLVLSTQWGDYQIMILLLHAEMFIKGLCILLKYGILRKFGWINSNEKFIYLTKTVLLNTKRKKRIM